MEFNGSSLKQDKIMYTHGKVVNIYIAYEISKNNNISHYMTLKNCLFGAVSLTKNADIDRYKYSGYGTGFDRRGNFSFPGTGLGQNVIIFGVDMRSSIKIDNIKKDILILGIKARHKDSSIHRTQKKCIQLILLSIIKISA